MSEEKISIFEKLMTMRDVKVKEYETLLENLQDDLLFLEMIEFIQNLSNKIIEINEKLYNNEHVNLDELDLFIKANDLKTTEIYECSSCLDDENDE
jgi:uncharacterized coiled-coil DUF342 family protein